MAFAAVTLLISSQTIARADAVRIYSVGADLSNSGSLTGVYSTHAFAQVYAPPSTNCTAPFNIYANAVYFTQWVYRDSGNQLEYGIGVNCGGQSNQWVYRYSIAFISGSWYWIITPQTLPGPDSNGHIFDVHRLGGTWEFWYDNVREPTTLGYDLLGTQTHAGIESNNYSTVVPNHWFSNLNSTANEGPWYAWGAQLGQNVTQPYMCGFFRTNQQWSGAENATCN
jgi:hypothetical protein